MASYIYNYANVPGDVLVEIFFRFSVQSLLCAKCVCKKWHALIQNPNFVLSHLRYKKSHNKGRLFLQYFKEDTQEHNYVLFDNDNLEGNTYHNIDKIQLGWYPIHIEGPINGLYCLFNGRDRIVLWNPVLMEYKALPLPHPHFFSHMKVCEGYTAFGTDSSIQDYKVVLLRRFKNEYDRFPRRYVTIYSLYTDTWRHLNLGHFDLTGYGFYENKNSSFQNGSCHWWTTSGVVIAFDMVEEKFRKILGPNVSDSESSAGSLTIYNDKLSLMISYEYSVDTWVMSEGLWFKQFSITSLPRFFYEVGLWKNDGLLLAIDGYETEKLHSNIQMVLFNLKTQEMRVVGPKGMPMCFRASVYYESLVSVDKRANPKGEQASLNTISNFLMPGTNPYLD